MLSLGMVLLTIATYLRYSIEGGLAGALRFAAVAAQLGLGFAVLDLYEIEASAFHQFVYPLVLSGFLGLHFLPRSLRPPIFLAMSVGAMFGVLGVIGGTVLLGIGSAFIGICHLPIAWSLRILMILALGGGLAAIRAGAVSIAPVDAVLPILASIFMFRLVIYIYDIRNGAGPQGLAQPAFLFFHAAELRLPVFSGCRFQPMGPSATA